MINMNYPSSKMTTNLTLEEIKILIFALPILEQISLMDHLSEKLETFSLMKISETGFSEWHDPEEAIYNDEP